MSKTVTVQRSPADILTNIQIEVGKACSVSKLEEGQSRIAELCSELLAVDIPVSDVAAIIELLNDASEIKHQHGRARIELPSINGSLFEAADELKKRL